MIERKYLPTFPDLVDRLSIVLMKSIFISEYREKYREEMGLIMDDIASIQPDIDSRDIFAALVLMLVNREIWLNESAVRSRTGKGDLHFTHSLNGVRNQAKNKLARMFERTDHKIDCLAEDLPESMGNWRVFE